MEKNYKYQLVVHSKDENRYAPEGAVKKFEIRSRVVDLELKNIPNCERIASIAGVTCYSVNRSNDDGSWSWDGDEVLLSEELKELRKAYERQKKLGVKLNAEKAELIKGLEDEHVLFADEDVRYVAGKREQYCDAKSVEGGNLPRVSFTLLAVPRKPFKKDDKDARLHLDSYYSSSWLKNEKTFRYQKSKYAVAFRMLTEDSSKFRYYHRKGYVPAVENLELDKKLGDQLVFAHKAFQNYVRACESKLAELGKDGE